MSKSPVTQKEFSAVRKDIFVERMSPQRAQTKYDRGETTIRAIKNAKSWPAYVRNRQAQQERRKAKEALAKQTDNEITRSTTVLTREHEALAVVHKAQKQRSFIGRFLARFKKA